MFVWLGLAMARAEVRVVDVFGSGMVVQQQVAWPVWGWADAGEEISVRFDEREAKGVAAGDGAWGVLLPAMPADGRAHRLTVSGKNTVVFDDVLIGEVWIGSGQSNMARPIGKSSEASASRPQIRLLHVPPKYEKTPSRELGARWVACSPESAAEFSAVLFHFGVRLHEELHVPVGLIEVSRGSTAIEQFLPPPTAGPLYHGSIAPLVPVAMRGIVWYQGEANVQLRDGFGYGTKQRALIEGWRGAWGREFSFYLVQLAPLKNYQPDLLPPVWEAQAATLKLPRTGMVVTTDLAGNLTNIHPANKKDVGDRLARWALAKDYGRAGLVYSGPLYQGMAVEGGGIRLRFHYAAGGLKSRDGAALSEFQIAGSDGKFVAATATIEGDTVFVRAERVTAPAHVRFGWHNAANPNLVNSAGLPAAPFHTDGWQGGGGW